MFTKSRRKLFMAIPVTVALLLGIGTFLSYVPAMAGVGNNRDNLKLFEQDALGRINQQGAKGNLDFTTAGPSFNFEFEGDGLPPTTDYSLIRSREPGVTLPYRFDVIGKGTSNLSGSLEISGSYAFNMTLISAQILLVPTSVIGPPQPDGALSLLPQTSFPRCLFGQGAISYTYTGVTTPLQGGNCFRPQVSPPPKPLTSWDLFGPKVGEVAIDFTVMGMDPATQSLVTGNTAQPLTTYKLSELCAAKPVVLVFGAFT
jgi:hypothetical protein